MKVIHAKVNDKEDIVNFIGSKYVQSDMKNTISDIKRILDKGGKTMFCGTPY